MSPFYPGPGGIEIQNEGTVLAGATILNFETGGAILNDGTVSYSANALEITNGTITVNPLSVLTIGSGLVLSVAENAPTVAQKAFFPSASGNVELPNPPAAGNLVVMMAFGQGPNCTFPSTATVQFVAAAAHGLELATQVAAGSTNYTVGAASANGCCVAIYEIAGWSTIIEAATAVFSTNSPYIPSIEGSASNNCLVLYGAPSYATDSPASVTPNSWVLDDDISWAGNYHGCFLRQPSVEAATVPLEYTQSETWDGWAYGYITIAGVAAGAAATIAT